MELDDKTTSMIKKAVTPIVVSATTATIVGAAFIAIKYLTATNYKQSDLTGDKGLHPTKNDTIVSKTEATAKDTDASLAKDEVKAKDGDLSAAKTDGNAMTTEATALESGAAAARTKAGAADIETKALKMT